MRMFLALLLVLVAAPALADPPSLRLPLDCRLGEDCWIANYPDSDPGPGSRDYTCAPRSYDGHTGVDIALRDREALEAGVPVLAVAAGKVVAARDEVEDGLWLAGRKDEVKAARRECGNRVAVAHGDGWVTDYCHMRQGSIRVKVGDMVAAGQPLGLVGLSGMTEFPHIHVGLLRFAPGKTEGVPVDPFTGALLSAGCGQPPKPLWGQSLPYQAGDLYAVGFADHLPTADEVKRHAQGLAVVTPDAPALVAWATLFGVKGGDRLGVRLTAPDGSTLLEQTIALDRDQAWRMAASGKKRPVSGWVIGRYQAVVIWERPGRPPQMRTTAIEVRP
ncbi:M23 family metallopeptidase [Magnetospirillum aberrantis]|uniref:M23 family metallopeptidase n=1 Tax=Magnetospirillum aberrantis SpK TaxID=908842 RepID=A0A7C9UXI0_9PROT|nr:M23 family metallopeptidase [Magnetospirillum aberrantis]NFV80892.1 M23 family metallopeptidase [Magnetospirillum aberrantis SpK]